MSDTAVVSLRVMIYPGNIMHKRSHGRCELTQAKNLEHGEQVISKDFLRYKGLERPGFIFADVMMECLRYQVRMNIIVLALHTRIIREET